MSVKWELRAWERNGRVYRHWIDVELAIEWARRFRDARSRSDQLVAADAFRRWWEAANLGAYAMRAVGVDPLSAPLARFTVEGPDGRRGLPGAPLEVGRLLLQSDVVRNAPKTAGPSMPSRSLWTPRLRVRVYRFGAIQTDEQSPDKGAFGLSDELPSAVSMVFSSEGLDSGRFEHRLHETLIALGAEGPSSTFVRDTKAAGTFPSWKVWEISRVPGVSLAVRWHPVLLDGWWEVVWLDSREARLRTTAALAIPGRCEPEVYDFPEGRAPFFGAPSVSQERWVSVPLDALADGWIRDEEISSFLDDPWAFVETYVDAIIERNRAALLRIDRSLANRAEIVSMSREAAVAASMIAVDRASQASRDENLAALDEVSASANLLPVLGSIAAAMAQGFGRMLAAFGAFDMPDAQKQEILRDTIAPLAISGTITAESPRAPSHPVFLPSGWTRPERSLPAPGAVFAERAQGGTSRTFDPAVATAAQPEGELFSAATMSRRDYLPPRPYADLFDPEAIERAARRASQPDTEQPPSSPALPVALALTIGGIGYYLLKK